MLAPPPVVDLPDPGCHPARPAAVLARALKVDLRKAVARGELELHYQPLVSLGTGAVTGCEALLRWRRPGLGLVPPGDFIPLAEATGLIVPIGRWILLAACRDASRWPAPVRVAVNLSPRQLRSPSLPRDVAAALAATGLAPERLELELTESLPLDEDPAALARLAALQALGVRIALDDFGTGYASLSHLRRFAFDKLKLDRSFVAGLDAPGGTQAPGSTQGSAQDSAQAIMQAVGGLARSLRMSVVAEGVETHGQFEALRRAGYEEAQGFLIGRPVPAAKLPALLAALAEGAGVPGALIPDDHPARGPISGVC